MYSILPQHRWILAEMRLVSKALCRAASPMLFQHIVALFCLYWPEFTVDDIRDLCNSSYASHVRHLQIGLGHFTDYDLLEAWAYLEELAASLPTLLSKLPNLYSVSFELDEFLSLNSDLIEAGRQFASAVASTLHSTDLPNLRKLKIHLPLTHSFRYLFPTNNMSSHLSVAAKCQRLRHMCLTVTRRTSLLGDHLKEGRILPEDAALPNENFAGNLFQLLEAAENLEALRIGCTNPLDFDRITFPLRLRTVVLSRLILTSNSLSSILGNSHAIRWVKLNRVQLKSGTWRDVLMTLSQSPPKQLLKFSMRTCGYSSTGESADLRNHVLRDRRRYDAVSIETKSESDLPALHCLQRIASKNRAALGLSANFETAMERDLGFESEPEELLLSIQDDGKWNESPP